MMFAFLSVFKQLPIKWWLVIGVFGIALAWSGYMLFENQRLEGEVKLYKTMAMNNATITELREAIFQSNNDTLAEAIDHQNTIFDQLAADNKQASDLILFRLTDQNKLTQKQYDEMNNAINTINVNSCEELVDALIQFGDDNKSWGSKNE